MLSITPAVYDDLIAHARAGAPEEVCGVLGGTHDPEHSRAATALRCENVAEEPRRAYALDPEEHLAAIEALEAAGEAVVGYYHSHPEGPAGPSPTDTDRATWDGHSYVIVSLDGEQPTVGSWRWTGEAFEPEEVRGR